MSIWAAYEIVNNENKDEKAKEFELNESVQQSHTAQTEMQASLDGKKKHGCSYYFKKWLKLTWQKKKIYASIVPHVFDQATDIGVVLIYREYIGDPQINEKVRVIYWYYLSIFFLVEHRLVSSVAVFMVTKNWLNVLLQLCDLLILKAVWTSYKLGSTEPSTSQRWLYLLEATFEAMPQLLLSAVFIAKTGDFNLVVVLSLLSSLWSLTARVSSDDKFLFASKWRSLDFSHKKCPCMNWRYIMRVLLRFMEISSRVCLLTLMWINLGGLATGIIICFESICLLVLSVLSRSIGNFGNLLYVIQDEGDRRDHCDCCEAFSILWACFLFYRFVSSYMYLILVTCFANIRFDAKKVEEYELRQYLTMNQQAIGFYMFIYAWSAFFVWPCIGCFFLSAEIIEQIATGRDFETLREIKDYAGIIELIDLGKQPDEEENWIIGRAGKECVEGSVYVDEEIKARLHKYYKIYPPERDSQTYKILFLGTGAVGKSTIYKQLKRMYGTGFTAKDKHDARSGIVFFVIDTMQTLLEDEDCHIDEVKDEEAKAAAQQIKSLRTNSTPSLDAATTNSIKILWRQQQIKDLFDNLALLYHNQTCAYFFDSIDRISDPSFEPTDRDILMQRRPTVGINEQFIALEEIERTRFQIVDTGGEKNERKKWIHQFEHCAQIVWVVSLSAFDEPLYEDESVNSMIDSLKAFEEIINSEALTEASSLLLIFNKIDLFRQKIMTKSLKTCFADEKYVYDEDEYYNHCENDEEKFTKNVKFIKEMFLNQVSEERMETLFIETAEMCALDESNVKATFEKALWSVSHVPLDIEI